MLGKGISLDPISAAWNTVGRFDDYESAQRAVDRLSDDGFPVEKLDIVGSGLRLVERVTGRLTRARASGAGALSGLWAGLLFGILLGLFTSGHSFLATTVTAAALGTGWGAVFGYVAHARTRGQRDFSSVSALAATHYDLIAREGTIDRARFMLGEAGLLPPVPAEAQSLRPRERRARASGGQYRYWVISGSPRLDSRSPREFFMIHPWNRAAEFSRIRAGQPLVSLAGALAAGCCVAACASGAASTAATTATATTAATATATATASSPAASTAELHGTPKAVLADWLHQIVVGDYKAACADMADTTQQAAPGPRATAACAASKAVTTLTALHGNFTADGLKAATPISVTSAQVAGTKATVSGTEVSTSGTTLSSLIIAHSTGVTAKSFALSFKLAKVDGGWYVTDLDMNI
jgi:hypothetical protein